MVCALLMGCSITRSFIFVDLLCAAHNNHYLLGRIMSQEYYAEFPVQVTPRLRGGKIHKMRITPDGITVTTWPGLYGNKESVCVLEIDPEQIVHAQYHAPLLDAGEGNCKVRYVNEDGVEQGFKLHIVDPALLSGDVFAQAMQNAYTETLAAVLQGMQHGASALPALPNLTLKVPNASQKLLYGIGAILLGLVLTIGAVVFNNVFLTFSAPFLLCVSVGALGVDYVHVHTGWHPLVKLLIAVIIIFVVLVAFAGVIFWSEAIGIM